MRRLVAGGVYFGAPFIMPILDRALDLGERAFDWGADNWKEYIATGDFPNEVDAIPENVSDGVDRVQSEFNDFRENLRDDLPPQD